MTNEITKTTSQEVMSPEDKAIEEQLRTGSGEAEQVGNYVQIPYLTIDNKKVTAKLEGGGEAEVLCPRMFLLNTKEGDKYIKEDFVPEFRAVILAVRHRAQRKYLSDGAGGCDNKLDFYRTLEFKSFQNMVHVRIDKTFLPPLSYQEVKNMSPEGKENELWGIAYVLIDGEDTVRKVEVKGASRGVLFDYIIEKRDTSVSAIVTNFTQEVVKGAGFSYNILKLENTGERPANIAEVLKAQTELNKILDAQSQPSVDAVQGEVIEKVQVTSESTLEDITKTASEVVANDTTEAVPTPEKEADANGLEKMFA